MKNLLFAAALVLLSPTVQAQVAEDSDLFQTMATLDAAIFEQSFNRCDHSRIRELVTEDFEFYHDTGGFENSKQSFMDTVERNICGNPEIKPIRKLVPGSVKVYPLHTGDGTLYGAIQEGYHEFYLREDGKPLRHTSSARFTHVWILRDGQWTLKRVLSFDHRSPSEQTPG